MPAPNPTYISAATIASETMLTALGTLATNTPAAVEKLIKIAEDQIDSYCGRQQHHPDDTNTNRVFPRFEDQDDNGDPVMPYNVERAALRQVEYLYTQWYSVSGTSLLPTVKPISQESVGADGSYSVTFAQGGVDSTVSSLCDQAKQLLAGFVSRTAPISVSSPFTSEP